jgi:hypothetical protein
VVALSGLKARFAAARVVVVAGHDSALVDAIRRMGVANIFHVGCMEDAQARCTAGGADACIVVLPRTVPDERPAWTAATEAPGRGRVPALLIAEVVTPYVRQAARQAGYDAAIPLGLPPRMLYRCVGALLQASRRVKATRGGPTGAARHPAVRFGLGVHGSDLAGTGKPRLQ